MMDKWDRLGKFGQAIFEKPQTGTEFFFGERGVRDENMNETYHGLSQAAQRRIENLADHKIVAEIDGCAFAFPQTNENYRNIHFWYITDKGTAFGLNESPRTGWGIAISGVKQVSKFYERKKKCPSIVTQVLDRIHNSMPDEETKHESGNSPEHDMSTLKELVCNLPIEHENLDLQTFKQVGGFALELAGSFNNSDSQFDFHEPDGSVFRLSDSERYDIASNLMNYQYVDKGHPLFDSCLGIIDMRGLLINLPEERDELSPENQRKVDAFIESIADMTSDHVEQFNALPAEFEYETESGMVVFNNEETFKIINNLVDYGYVGDEHKLFKAVESYRSQFNHENDSEFSHGMI